MKLPDAEFAEVPIEKLRDFCLNPDHVDGRHKAHVFKSALDLGPENAKWLQSRILQEIRASNDVEERQTDKYGTRFSLTFELQHGGLSATIVTGWIHQGGDSAPWLTSCYVKKGK